MKQRNVKKKISSLLLAVAVMIGAFPVSDAEVHAAGLRSAAPGQFVTKEQLKTFNTDNSDGSESSAKVYFGKNNDNNQEWWIAGSQGGDSVTLFAASPLGYGSDFVSDDETTKPYNAEWGCTYPGGAPSDVIANHYGASVLRVALKELETSCFSTAEQDLMQETTIYTNDAKNNCAYSTTDKLYPAYGGAMNDTYITVGKNAPDDLNSGLRIENAYWGNEIFWLRAPYDTRGLYVLTAVAPAAVGYNTASIRGKVVPAFELNLSSVLFASAAKAASSETTYGTIDDGAAMTLRLDGRNKKFGTVSYDAETGAIVTQKDAGAEGTVSLVVQGGSDTHDWYYSVPVGEGTSVTKKQIQEACGISGIALAECKIWLETTEDSVTYAKMVDAIPSKYATAEKLKGFNTDDTDGKNSAKVYFGKNKGNSQEWWIAGSQKAGSVTLFAASPLGENQEFDPSDGTKTYSAEWGCSYSGSAPSEVKASHYGASALRTALKELETSCFSTAEQALMQETTIYTNDTKNNCAYSTTDKLYPAYAEYSGNYITVGENTPDNLNSGLRIEKGYWGSGIFWLRAPYGIYSDIALRAVSGSGSSSGVGYEFVSQELEVVPAFKLNLSSVLFASAAKTASSETTNGTIADDAAMALRLDGAGKTIGTVSYDAAAGKIAAQKAVGAAGTVSLVVQGSSKTSDWYYSVPAGEGTVVVTKEQIETACSISGIDLAECKIWLETTEGENSFAYAKMAEAKNFSDAATLAPGETLVRDNETITNGQDGTVTVDLGNDGTVDVTIRLPQAGDIQVDANGKITIPAGGTVQVGNGEVTTLPDGGTVDADGNVEDPSAKPEKPFGGSGTAQDPYKITSKDDLEKLRDLVNDGKDYEGIHFKVTADINLEGSGQDPWTPIGTAEHPFKGTLDGNGKTVSGLHINDGTKDNQGLFGVNGGTIENLTVAGTVTGKDNVGGIAGTNTAAGTVKGCTSNVTVTGENNVGGIAGKNEGTITGGTNNGTVTGTGTGVGGIAGRNDGTLDGDTNTAPVTGKDDVGGIAGTNGTNGTVEGCTNSGNVTVSGDGDSTPGAIIGNNQNTSPDAVKDDYYQKTDSTNKDLSGIGEGTGAGEDPAGITSGQTPTNPGNPIDPDEPFDGSGTAQDPYKITSKDDLEKLRDLVNDGKDYEGIHFKVTADINLEGSGQDPWTPIGTAEHPFKGTLDGNGKTVSGLHINDGTKDNQGLFGVNGGTIENLTVAGTVTGKDNVGGIAGTNTAAGTVKGCTSNVTVTGENNVGGIAGKNEGTITGGTNNGTVTGTGTGVGGIAGRNDGTLDGDTNTAPVTGKDDVGGIAGTNGTNGTVEGCTNSGNVTVSGDGDSTPGAIIGNNQNTSPDAVKDDYYQKTDSTNKDLSGIGEGTGAGEDPAGITSGQTPTNPGNPIDPDEPFDGSGTAQDPYKITSKDDLEKLRDLVNDGKDYEGIHFKVTADINLEGSGQDPWTPIGTAEHPFKGTLDGNGKTVSGLHINDGTKDNQGLFGVNGGTIENLTVAGTVTGKDNVGGIAGTNTAAGTVKGCTSNVTVTGENNVGGIAGKNDGTITGGTNSGSVAGTGTGTGGIAGNNNGTLGGNKNTAPVTGKNDVGGIAGTNGTNGTVEGCTNSGNVTGEGGNAPGAIIGNNQNTSPDAVKDDYYQKTESTNKDLTGIGEGTGAGEDPAGITSGQTPTNPGQDPAETDQAAAKAFEEEKIAAIERATPVGGAAWKQAVRDAAAAFEGLTGSQKELVSDSSKNILTDAQAILAAVEKIETIGTVTNTSECGQRIKDARDAYDKLTGGQKAKMPESATKALTDAENTYKALTEGAGGNQNNDLTEEQKKQVQTIAKELGVPEETAAKIQAAAEELGVPMETLLLGDEAFTSQKSENDIKGSLFSLLQLKAAKVKTNSVKLTWKKIKGADGYLVYGTRCGKGRKLKLLKTIKKNSTTAYTQKKLKKGKAYRYVVRAYKTIDGRRITIAASKSIHIYTDGGKFGNAKSVKVKKAKASIRKGKSFKIRASEIKVKKPLRRHRKLSYESSNTKVATVTKSGVIKGKGKGTCTVYAYAQNGVYKKIKVTVK